MSFLRFVGFVVASVLTFTGPWWLCVAVLAVLFFDAVVGFARRVASR